MGESNWEHICGFKLASVNPVEANRSDIASSEDGKAIIEQVGDAPGGIRLPVTQQQQQQQPGNVEGAQVVTSNAKQNTRAVVHLSGHKQKPSRKSNSKSRDNQKLKQSTHAEQSNATKAKKSQSKPGNK
uniref:Uncharacterized protein n=1 Tax=Panagrolaimus sp. ES5 TaxID=591445 RepID=A0AC34FSZ0_9BILA